MESSNQKLIILFKIKKIRKLDIIALSSMSRYLYWPQ